MRGAIRISLPVGLTKGPGGPIMGWGDPRRGWPPPWPGLGTPPPIPGEPTDPGGCWLRGDTVLMGLAMPPPGLNGLLSSC